MDKGTTTKQPMALRVDQVITAYPDPLHIERFGTAGRWTVTAEPVSYDAVVRVDATDTAGRPVVWVLPKDAEVEVELTDVELQVAAARLIARLADDPSLPDVYEWAIRDGKVSAYLAVQSWQIEQSHADMAAWAAFLPGEIVGKETDKRTRLTVEGKVDGVPVEVWTTVYTPDAAPEKAEAEA